jgi:uncharacterized membrane protein
MKPSLAALEKRVETAIANLLRFGVLLSAGLIVIGAALYLWRHGQSAAVYRVFRDDLPELRTVGGIFHSAFTLSGRGVIQLGLLALIATPVARVVLSIWGFAVMRDRTYVVIASLVLATLLYSLFGASARLVLG